jgi:glycosyltransferase involved in cell wall biosynthesis
VKFLIVHEVNYLSKIIYEFQILPEILSLAGHSIDIIDYNDTWNEDGAREPLIHRSKVYKGVHRAYAGAAVTVHRPGMIRLPLLSRVSAAITTAFAVRKALKRIKPDVVLLYGLPTVGIQTLALARYFKVPILFRSIDVIHQLVPVRVLRPVTKIFERIIFNHVDMCVAITPRLQSYILEYGVAPKRIRLLPSGVDSEMFSPGPRDSELLKKWGLEARQKIIFFMGTLYSFSGLDRIIDDFPRLLERHPDARLLIVGFGEDEARLRALAAKKNLDRYVIFTGMQPYESLPEFIRSADVCINPFELNGITKDILPTKLFQYMACGKPVMATRLPGTMPYLSGEEQGIVYAELTSFVDRLGDLLDQQALCEQLGTRGGQIARNHYDWKSIADSLVKTIEEVITCA